LGSLEHGGQWQPVPDEVIIHGPNWVGLPVVWWHYEYGRQDKVLRAGRQNLRMALICVPG